jgi:hypothetical protein
MNLEDVSKAVASHLSAPDDNNPSTKNESSRVRRMGILLFSGVVMLLLGATIMGVGKRMLQSELIMMIGLLIVMAGTVLAAYSVISPLWQQASKSRQSIEPTSSMETSSGINTSPEGLPAPFPSVTEQTTRVLENEEANG